MRWTPEDRASLSRLVRGISTDRARVAERQTRWLQVPVSARTWGFKSPLAHARGNLKALVRRMLQHCNSGRGALVILR